eukprot:6668035-Ditylum_brightwellii.AAC.1
MVAFACKKGYSEVDSRKVFQDFNEFIQSWIKKDEEFIIGKDANEADEENFDLVKFYAGNDLTEVFKCMHLEVTPPYTYQK